MTDTERAKRWAELNPERVKENHRRWREKNREKVRAYQRERMAAWRKKNPIKAKKQHLQTMSRRWKKDSQFRLLHSVRCRISKILRFGGNQKMSRTHNLLGCSTEELKSWLSGWFEDGMTWENYGTVWHVDHNFPCAIFDLSSLENQKRCFGFLNLRPLFAKENLSKRDNLPVLI